MTQYSWATSPAAVEEQVTLLRDHLLTILDGVLVGLYLHGSLAFGCFNPEWSDIDLLVVTARGMTLEEKRHVVELLLRSSMAPHPIEISFLVESAIHTFQHPLSYDLHYSEAWRERYHQQLANEEWLHWNDFVRKDYDLAVHITVTLARGIDLYGKPIRATLPVIPSQYYIEAIMRDFRDAGNNIAGNPIYFVLNACRVYAYLREGNIFSKDEGGSWGLRALPDTYHGLVTQALEIYRGKRANHPFNSADLDRFASYMQEQVQSFLNRPY